jgi:hypothetical protein
MPEGRSSLKAITTIIRADRHKGQLPILGVSRDRPLPLSLITQSRPAQRLSLTIRSLPAPHNSLTLIHTKSNTIDMFTNAPVLLAAMLSIQGMWG